MPRVQTPISSITVDRWTRGIKLHVKVHPKIVEFFKERSVGDTPLRSITRSWETSNDNQAIYDIEPLVTDSSTPYFLGGVGQDLEYYSESGSFVPNLSFLRCHGLDREPDPLDPKDQGGLTFRITGAFSPKKMRDLPAMLQNGIKAFYLDNIAPVSVTRVLYTEEEL